jgi:hypothetical protein
MAAALVHVRDHTARRESDALPPLLAHNTVQSTRAKVNDLHATAFVLCGRCAHVVEELTDVLDRGRGWCTHCDQPLIRLQCIMPHCDEPARVLLCGTHARRYHDMGLEP